MIYNTMTTIEDVTPGELYLATNPQTSALLARRMISYCGSGIMGCSVLEPSAGIGNIADAARAAGADVFVNEVDPACIQILKHKEYNPYTVDFRRIHPGTGPIDQLFDFVLMFPPWSEGRDLTHIQSGYNFLVRYGVLVAIVTTPFNLGGSRHVEFREWFESHGGEVMENMGDGRIIIRIEKQ